MDSADHGQAGVITSPGLPKDQPLDTAINSARPAGQSHLIDLCRTLLKDAAGLRSTLFGRRPA